MSWFSKLFGSKSQTPGSIAKDRLRLVLVQDRATCSPELLEMIKADILAVLAKYVEIGDTELDVQLSDEVTDTNERVSVLSANIPIKSMRKRTNE